MLKVELIGNLGADAEMKDSNGARFLTMRVAHTTRQKKDDGSEIERTIWVDVAYNNTDSAVVAYLKAGTKIFVRGNATLRVYSSKKDRCMKAGLTVSASEIELCGGNSEAVPRQLIIPDTGALVDVHKYYKADVDTKGWKKDDRGELLDSRGNHYLLVKDGWVSPWVTEEASQNG